MLAPPAPGVESVTLVVEFTCADAVRELLIRDDLFDAFGDDHHTIGRIDAPGSTMPFAFAPDTREVRLTVGGSGAGLGLASFVALGIEHILTGWDHLLFLLALLLHGGGLLAVVKIVTAFTVAHSVTLRCRRWTSSSSRRGSSSRSSRCPSPRWPPRTSSRRPPSPGAGW